MEETPKFLIKIFEYDYGKGGRGVDKPLCNYQGGVQPILTVPYSGGKGGQLLEKLPYVNNEHTLNS